MRTNKKIRIYQDSKELPFWNYKRIIQTGDFLYMIRGYEAGDDIKADKKLLKSKFDDIIQDYAVSINAKNEEVEQYGKLAISTNEVNKLNIIIYLIDIVIKTSAMRLELNLQESEDINSKTIKDLLSDIKVERSENMEVQKQKILDKIEKHKNQISKIESQLKNSEDGKEGESDLDEQYISVCLGLEMHVDEKLISLYQYGIMVKLLIERVEAINKIKKNG